MKLTFGERNIVVFSDEADFYLCLGFLMNTKKGIRFDWEIYDNKWGIEARIWIKDSSNAPTSLRNAFSAGTKDVDYRLNCNEYVLYLSNNFGISVGSIQNLAYVESKVPKSNLADYYKGLSL